MLHPFEPVFDKHSSILILGTFPSEKSRKYGFFYGHPQNRFWKLLTLLTKSEKIPESIEEKKSLLLKNGIALWDVIHSCDIKGSSDASIMLFRMIYQKFWNAPIFSEYTQMERRPIAYT